MKEYLLGVVCGAIFGMVFGVLHFDTSASTFYKAEEACVALNSHAASFDASTVTCLNEAVFKFR